MSSLMMYNGNLVDVFNIKKEDISKEIIIKGLCRINRFLGQTTYPYPVASHIIGGYRYLKKINADVKYLKEWVLHEAYEAYTGVDLPSPLKAILKEYKDGENQALKIVSEVFKSESINSDYIKGIDKRIMISEALILTNNIDYWIDFAEEHNIKPLERDYVLEYKSEKELKETLNQIFNELFQPHQ